MEWLLKAAHGVVEQAVHLEERPLEAELILIIIKGPILSIKVERQVHRFPLINLSILTLRI